MLRVHTLAETWRLSLLVFSGVPFLRYRSCTKEMGNHLNHTPCRRLSIRRAPRIHRLNILRLTYMYMLSLNRDVCLCLIEYRSTEKSGKELLHCLDVDFIQARRVGVHVIPTRSTLMSQKMWHSIT
ncbi:hypothetical protein BD779DRAFT_219197 [Infundibulicybe gibba]|nr:hypothetical protein BD779DRAFT_219197 [Infundibulicybe gibba]